MSKEKLNGVLMRNKKCSVVTQIASDLTFGEAFSLVWDLRSKRDENYYWIGSL